MATSNSANLVTEIAAAPVSFRRRAMNALVTGAAAGAVLLAAGRDFCLSGLQGLRLIELGLSHANPEAGWRSRRRHG